MNTSIGIDVFRTGVRFSSCVVIVNRPLVDKAVGSRQDLE